MAKDGKATASTNSSGLRQVLDGLPRSNGVPPTPGPWKVRWIERSGYDCMTDAIHIVIDTPSPSIAVLDLAAYGQQRCETPTPEMIAQAWANARLIAAAPDLLKVAHWALSRLVSVSDLSDEQSEAMQLQRALRAAITKAEGR